MILSAGLVSAVTFSAAVIGGALGTFGVRAMAVKIGFVANPNPIVPQHTRPIAYLGGVGVSIGAIVAVIVLSLIGGLDNNFGAILSIGVPALLFLGLGVADDLRRFSAALKFTAQTLIAVVAVVQGMVYPFSGIAVIDDCLSMLFILVLVNAFNLIDVCDGLLAGLCVIIFLMLSQTDSPYAIVSLATAGACAGFLLFNFPPASIFLGDAGSHVLGFLAAALVLTGGHAHPAFSYWTTTLLVLAIPLFELGFLVVVRTRKGLSWFRGSPDHFSLRLQVAGLSRQQTVGSSWFASAVFAGIAWVAASSSIPGQVALIVVAGVLLIAAAVLLLRWEVEVP